MFEVLIEKLILSYFGDYIENLDRNKLSLGLWSGSLTLEDIKINPKSINRFKLPFKFLFGKIKKLSLLIPWKQNFSVPTEITIDSVQIVLTATSDSNKWDYTDYNNYENKLYYLLKFSNERMLQLAQSFIEETKKMEMEKTGQTQPKAPEKQNTFWEGMVLKILDNLQVKFKNVHIRIEAPFDNNHTSFGMSLEEMFVVNTNDKWEEEFIDRNVHKNANIFKLLKISNFGIYLNPNETSLFYNIYETNIKEKTEKETFDLIEQAMNEVFPEGEKKLINMEYLIEPMSLTAKMTQRNDMTIVNDKDNDKNIQLPKIHLVLELDKFNFDIQKEQYDCIIKIINTVSQYHQILHDFNNTNKFKFYRPRIKLSEALKSKKEDENKNKDKINLVSIDEYKKQIIKEWLKFAGHMIVFQIKYIKKNNKNIFNIYKILVDEYQKTFELLYKKYYLIYNENKKTETLTDKELRQLYYIIEITDLNDLYIWSSKVLEEIFTEKKMEEKKYNNTSYLGYIFGTKFNEDELITKEEKDKIKELLTIDINKAMKIITNLDKETKLQIDFILNEGSFKFTKYFNEQKITEGFEFQYKGFFFSTKQGESFNEYNLHLDKISVYLFNIINNNIISIPITYKFLEQGGHEGKNRILLKKKSKGYEPIIINKKNKKTKDYNSDKNVDNNNDSESVFYKYETFNSVCSDFDDIDRDKLSVKKYHRKLSSINFEEFIENQESEYSDANEEIRNSINTKSELNDNFKEDNKYFMTLFFYKNLYNTDDNINSKLKLYINVLHITYHQVFLERLINFLKVPLDEDLASKAFDKFEQLKLDTQQSIINNIYKKNIIQIYIEPRKILIPINKYDIKNSKILLVDFGRIDSNNNELNIDSIDYTNYKEKYGLYINSFGVNYYSNYEDMIKDKNKFEIISKMTIDLTFGFLNPGLSDEKYPLYKFFLNINSMNIDLNCYIYTIFIHILNILRPTKEIDLWSQLNINKKEIKTNSKASGFILKKNYLKKYQQYYAVLSGGYIYFYYDNDENDYIAYYHLKNCIMKESDEELSLNLSSNNGNIELKLLDKKSYEQWKKNINDRITEMKISYKFQESEKLNQENIQTKKENTKQIYFGAEINFKKVCMKLHNEENEVFIIANLSNLKSNLALRLYDNELHMEVQSLTIIDNLAKINEFQTILTTENKSDDKNKKILDLNIIICEEKSDRYKNIEIDVDMNMGTCFLLWNPPVIKNMISFLIYNDIQKYNVNLELNNQNITITNKDFISPSTFTLNRQKCSKYVYMNIHSSFSEIRIILIQPILKIKFNEMRFGPSFLDYENKVDHFVVKGELGNTQLFDLSQYPFVIKNQAEYDPNKIKEIFGIKKNSNLNNGNNDKNDSSLIKFYYKSMNPWCPEVKDNYTSEADVVINQSMLVFIYEQFMRFFNYFISQFLGSFSAPEKVKKFKESISQIKPKQDKDIDFLKLNVVINSPQIILKPRYHMKEYFLIDLGDINLSVFYQKIFGRLRKNPDDYRWLSTYQIDMKNFSIKTHDNFDILNNSNLLINMHFVYSTEEDKLLNEVEFDSSYQFDLIIDNLDMNLRQKDLTNLLRCSDLNILYTDNKSKFYDYDNYSSDFKLKKGKKSEKLIRMKNTKPKKESNSESSSIDESYSTENKNKYNTPIKDQNKNKKIQTEEKDKLTSSAKKDILSKYCSLICYLLIKKISIKLYLSQDYIKEDEENELNMYYPFVELLLKETQTVFTKKLDLSNETRIKIADMELLEILSSKKKSNTKFKILSEFTQNLITGERDDFENNLSDEISSNILNRRKYFKESTIKEEKIFKFNNDEYNDDPIKIFDLENSLRNSKNEISKKRRIKMTSIQNRSNILNKAINDLNNLQGSENEENININNIKYGRTGNRRSTVKFTKNNNKSFNENSSEQFMNQIYTLIKKCAIVPYKEMIEQSSKIQVDILINIDSAREKYFQFILNGFKLLMRIDIFQLCRYFFLEGFPFYDKTSKDLPNLFDPDEDNRPGNKLYIKLNNPIICFLTDDISNKEQELICITSEVTFGIKNVKMNTMKDELVGKYYELFNELEQAKNEEEKNKIENELKSLHTVNNIIKCDLSDVCPFICDYKDLDNKNNQNLFVSKRKIMNDFVFSYISEYIISYNPEENTFLFKNLQNIILFTDINIKASYRDIVLYLNLYNYIYSLLTEEYYKKCDILMFYTHQREYYKQKEEQNSKENAESELTRNESLKNILSLKKFSSYSNLKLNIMNNNIYGENQILFISKGLKLILIDDHSDTLYPFIDFSIKKLKLSYISNPNIANNNNKNNMNIIKTNLQITNYSEEKKILSELKGEISFKIFTYNYIAGEWEPLLELCELEYNQIKKTGNKSTINISTKNINKKEKIPDININISDLTVIFLYTTLNKWFDKYMTMQKDYNEIKKYKYLKNMSIINHTIYNYSGRELNIHIKTLNLKPASKMNIDEIDSNKLDFFINNQENYKIKNILPNNSYNVELDNNDYFYIKKQKSNYIKLYVENAHVSNHIIQIDNLQKKYHRVNYNEVNSMKLYLENSEDKSFFDKYCFLISKIELQGLKKVIYFYSPLAFCNKTNFTFEIKINNEMNIPKIYQLASKETIGIPFEYLNGTLEIKLEGCTEIKKFKIYEDFLTSEIMVEPNSNDHHKLNTDYIDDNLNELENRIKKNKNILKELSFIGKFNQKSYINLSFNNPKESENFTEFYYSSNTPIDKLNRIINLNTSYTLLNCLPFDIKIIFNDEFIYDKVQKNEKINLTNISVFSPLKMKLFIKEYSTKNSIVIYDIYKEYKENTNFKSMTISLISDDPFDKTQIMIQVSLQNKLLILHANSIIVNHSMLNLSFQLGHKENNIKKKVANQKDENNYYIINDEQFMQISYLGENNNLYKSDPISISAIGNHYTIELKNIEDKTQIELIMQINLSLLNIKLDLYCKIIKIVPRYILYNQLKKYDLDTYLDNIGSNKHFFLCKLKKEQKKPLYFTGIKERDLLTWNMKESKNNQRKNEKQNIIRLVPDLRINDNKNENGMKEKEIDIKNDKDIYLYSVSSPYSTEGDALVTLMCKYKDKNKDIINTNTQKDIQDKGNEEKFYFNIEKRNYDLSNYLIIKETTDKYCQIYISNLTDNISFDAWQKNNKDKSIFLGPKKSSIFVWNDATKKQIINFRFYLKNIKNTPENLYSFELFDNKIKFLNNNDLENDEKEEPKPLYSYEDDIKLYLINNKNKNSYYIFHLSINFNGNQILIEMKNLNSEAEINLINNLTILGKTKYNINIKKLGISIIGDNKHVIKNSSLNKKYERKEICYITLDQINFIYKYEQLDKLNQSIYYNIDIKDIEIDNELSYITNYPIILLPVHSPRRKEIKHETTDEINSDNHNNENKFFNCSLLLSKKEGEKITKINLFKYVIQPFDINIESSIFVSFFNLINNLSNGMSTSLTYINPLFQKEEYLKEHDIKIKDFYYEPGWMKEKIPELNEEDYQKIIFINELNASSLEFNLTFIAQTKDQMFEKILKLNDFLTGILNVLNKTENVPLLLHGGISYNLLGNISQIFNILFEIYKQQILIQFVKLFGGMEILGNPINFLNNIGKGFQDLLTKPGEGLMQGPIEAAKGLADGATSLVKHTVNGTFNSTSKITSGISQGILYLTQDEEYINEREQKKITEKPKDIMEGFGFGLSAMVGGVFSGISDIILKPIEETKKKGILDGLTKGVLKGLGGAIIKPISGVFDFVSKTTEGIKNGVNDDRIINRIREPRVFYGILKVIKEYNYNDAYVKRFLCNEIQEIKESEEYNFVFYGFVLYKNKREEPIILVFVHNGFWVVDIYRKELKGIIAYSDIKNVELVKNDLIRIHFNKPINNENFYNIKLSNDTKNPEKIVNKLKDAINSNNWKNKLK